MITDKYMDLHKEMKSIKTGYYYMDKQKKRDKIELLKIFISQKVSRRKGTKNKGDKQKISKDIDTLSSMINKVNLIDICRTLH